MKLMEALGESLLNLGDGQLNLSLAEKEFMKHEQVGCPVVHRFGPGIYVREVMIPAGSIAIGHHQNFEHLNVFLKGRVTMLNDDGSTTELRAPMIFTGKPGRKIGFIHEDMVWLNVYSTTEQDVEKLERHFLTKSDDWKASVEQIEGIRVLKGHADNQDFLKAIEEFGFNESQVREQSECSGDLVELPFGGYKIKTAKSEIEGMGLFATADIEAGEVIAPARINGKRTIAGRYTNHSITPNAKMVKGLDCEIALVALLPIKGCKGGLDGDEITVDYRESIKLILELDGGQKCQE